MFLALLTKERVERVKLLKGQQEPFCFLTFAGPQWGWVGIEHKEGPLVLPRALAGLIPGTAVSVLGSRWG